MGMFLVIREQSGHRWQAERSLEAQEGFAGHAAFMNGLVEAGVVVLGGPLSDGVRVALAIEADSAEAVATRLAADPWTGSHLRIVSIEPWTILLDGRPAVPA